MSRTLTVYLAADLKKFSGGMKDAENQAKGLGGTLKGVLGPALIGAGVAAGAFAVKLGVDGVKAALEDEKAVAALATTLDNLNMAHSTEAVEAYIYELERAYGVADTELRPAYDRLVRSTKDTEEANRALKISMDISAATGKSLQTIVDNLGRAYDGNVDGLSRLGLGIDRTALRTMEFDDIVNTLASTFAGQADASAATFEGQLQRLTTATDNLKEAFGAGLLEALGDTDEATQDAVEAMEDMEGTLRGIGKAAGTFATTGLKTYTDATREAGEASEQSEDQMNGLTTAAEIGGGLIGEIFASLSGPNSPLGVFLRMVGSARQEMERLAGGSGSSAGEAIPTLNGVNFALIAQNSLYRDAAVNANRLANETSDLEEEADGLRVTTGAARQQVEALTTAQEKLVEKYDLAGIAFQTSKTELIAQIGVLEQATAAVEDYANTIQQDLLSGFDLGALAEGNLDEQGKLNAESFFKGFDDAINQAQWFGNVLNELKRRGVDGKLIADIAGLGPAVGGALAQNLIEGDGALLATFTDKWAEVQRVTRELALGLVPEYLEAGRLSAIDNLNGLATQFAADQEKFKRLGNKLGQQVGDEFAKRMLKEIADAVREVEAIATAARAEAVAAAQAEQARLTEQAVASAIAGLIRNSDQRTGRSVQPVLT